MIMSDLQKTLEKLRSDKYANLDEELVRNIIGIQADFMENQTEAYKRISQALDEYLYKEGPKSC